MSHTIRIAPIEYSRLSTVDFNNIPFGKVFSDHMFVADFIDGSWTNIEIRPIAPFEIHPGNLAWHYGQSIFEGMKATIDGEGTPLLFRPEEHVYRLNASARRMCMPEVPEQLFLDAINTLVDMEKGWIPPVEGSALYLRPLMFATDEAIGVRPSETYRFLIFAMPVGPYYAAPVHLKAETEYVRAVKGGVGEAKTAGNYAASLYPAKLAREQGFDQIMWLDAHNFEYVQEVGTMNIFFVINGTIVTPSTDGAILKGITRKSLIDIFKHEGYTVEERPVTIHELVAAYDAGQLTEVFGSGTAAVVSMAQRLHYKGKDMTFDVDSYTVAPLAKRLINGMRSGRLADPFGWVVKVKNPYKVTA